MLVDLFPEIEGTARSGAALMAHGIQEELHALSSRTGLPVVVLALFAVVLAWRVGRRSWHVILELVLAFGVLFAATKLGWIPW